MAKKAKLHRPSTTYLIRRVDQVCEGRLDHGARKYGDADWENTSVNDLVCAAIFDWGVVKMECISPGIHTTAEQTKVACADLINRLRMIYGKFDGVDKELGRRRRGLKTR